MYPSIGNRGIMQIFDGNVIKNNGELLIKLNTQNKIRTFQHKRTFGNRRDEKSDILSGKQVKY